MVTGRSRRVVVVLLALWGVVLVRLTLWPQLSTPDQEDLVLRAVAWLGARGVPITYLGLEAVANVVLFVPFGLLVGLLMAARRWLVVPAGLLLSSLIETGQRLFLPDRVPSVQDVILNTLGACVGWLVLTATARHARPT